jgi:hypothetical protein
MVIATGNTARSSMVKAQESAIALHDYLCFTKKVGHGLKGEPEVALDDAILAIEDPAILRGIITSMDITPQSWILADVIAGPAAGSKRFYGKLARWLVFQRANYLAERPTVPPPTPVAPT